MSDHADYDTFEDATPTKTLLELEAERMNFAASRVRELTRTEIELLERAVRAPDDDTARHLEWEADAVWRDAVAMSAEHKPDAPAWIEEDWA